MTGWPRSDISGHQQEGEESKCVGTGCRALLPGVCGSNWTGVCSHLIVCETIWSLRLTDPAANGLSRQFWPNPQLPVQKYSPKPARNLYYASLLSADIHPSIVLKAFFKLPYVTAKYLKCGLFSPEHLLPFFCTTVLVFFVHELFGLVSSSEIWLSSHNTSMKITSDQTSSDCRWEYQGSPAGVS